MEDVSYNGYVIRARIHELRAGGFSAEAVIEKHDGRGVHLQGFPLKHTFATREEAEKAVLAGAQQLIDRRIDGLTI